MSELQKNIQVSRASWRTLSRASSRLGCGRIDTPAKDFSPVDSWKSRHIAAIPLGSSLNGELERTMLQLDYSLRRSCYRCNAPVSEGDERPTASTEAVGA